MHSTLMLGAAVVALAPAAVHAQEAPAQTPNPTEIVVTASPFGTDTPTITAKVDRNQILETGGANIADALQNVPGISATDFASGASRPIIRGMDATRVRLLEDGTSSSDVSDIGPDHGVPIDPLAAQSIEVVRGPSTLRYGSQAIGGVINVLNNRVPLSLPTQPVAAEFDGSVGTVNDEEQAAGLIDAKFGNSFALHADAFWRHTGDYDTPDGEQANSHFHGHGEALGGSWFDGDTHLGGGTASTMIGRSCASSTTASRTPTSAVRRGRRRTT